MLQKWYQKHYKKKEIVFVRWNFQEKKFRFPGPQGPPAFGATATPGFNPQAAFGQPTPSSLPPSIPGSHSSTPGGHSGAPGHSSGGFGPSSSSGFPATSTPSKGIK